MKNSETRKPYSAPKLTRLGDVGKITAGKGHAYGKSKNHGKSVDHSGSICFGGKD